MLILREPNADFVFISFCPTNWLSVGVSFISIITFLPIWLHQNIEKLACSTNGLMGNAYRIRILLMSNQIASVQLLKNRWARAKDSQICWCSYRTAWTLQSKWNVATNQRMQHQSKNAGSHFLRHVGLSAQYATVVKKPCNSCVNVLAKTNVRDYYSSMNRLIASHFGFTLVQAIRSARL